MICFARFVLYVQLFSNFVMRILKVQIMAITNIYIISQKTIIPLLFQVTILAILSPGTITNTIGNISMVSQPSCVFFLFLYFPYFMCPLFLNTNYFLLTSSHVPIFLFLFLPTFSYFLYQSCSLRSLWPPSLVFPQNFLRVGKFSHCFPVNPTSHVLCTLFMDIPSGGLFLARICPDLHLYFKSWYPAP